MYLVRAEGVAFETRPELRVTLDLLDNYEACFSRGMYFAQRRLDLRPVTRAPRVYIDRLQSGSLEAYLTIIAAQLTVEAARYTPQIATLAWETFKQSFRLVEFSVGLLDRVGRPPQFDIGDITIQPHLEINGDDNVVQVDRYTYDFATQSHKQLENIASQVQAGKASRVGFSSEEDTDQLFVDDSNKDKFRYTRITQTDPEPVEVEANIYRMNKETLKGKLEALTGDQPQKIPFTFTQDQVDLCAQAFTATWSRLMVYREFQLDALGQTTISSMHLAQIIETNR